MSDPISCLTGKIELLNLLNNLPERPSTNETNPSIRVHEGNGRTIALKHEVSITQQLAFICANSNNPLHVTAICIEEAPADASLTFRLTANSGKHENLVQGLTRIGQILQNEALNIARSTNRETLFKVVVALNQNRILSRVRSRHAAKHAARHATRQRSKVTVSLLQKLRTASQLLQSSSLVESIRVRGLTEEIDSLQEQFDSLEDSYAQEGNPSHPDEHLLALVSAIHSFFARYEGDIERIPITPGMWDETATKALIDRLRKFSQYVNVCEELLKAARRYEVFTDIVVDFVNLQQSGKRLSSTRVDEVINASYIANALPRVSIHRRESPEVTKGLIEARLLERSRLHAELQLVLFYEQDGTLLRPRVICSSKRACYLCNLFVKLHGAYHIPETHGRLYSSWRWPESSLIAENGTQVSLDWILPAFSNAIELKIQHDLSLARLPARIEPFESTVDLVKAMTPSIQSHNTRRIPSPLSGDLRNEDDGTSYGTSRTGRNRSRQLSSLSERRQSRLVSPSGRTVKPSSSSSSTLTCIADTQTQPLFIKEGDTISHSFSMGNTSLQVYSRHLHVSLQYEISSAPVRNLDAPYTQNRHLQMEVECLSSSTHEDQNSSFSFLDLQDCDWVEKEGLESALFSTEGLLLKQHTTLIRLRGRKMS